MTFGDILVLAVLGGIVGVILGRMYQNKKKGNTGCCSCPHAGSCPGSCGKTK